MPPPWTPARQADAPAPSALQRARQRLRWLGDSEALARWVDGYRGRPGARAFAVRQVEIFVHTARSIHTEEIGRRAAGLTYYTLLSLVPLLAVGFALFEAFGGLANLREPLKALVVDWLAAGHSEEVGAWLDQFIANVKAGAIAGFGVLVLFYSAIGLLTNVERAFNQVWGVQRLRPLHVRFVIYWCVLTLAPPLVGLSISLSAQLQSSSFATAVLEWLPFGLGRVLVSAASALSVSVAFIVTYKIVPNTKVELRCAALGGLVASLLWSASKALFIVVTAGSVKYSAVYGALSTLPLLMLWLYLSWTIVLFGVAYTSLYQTMAGTRLQAATAMSAAFRERLAARLLVEIARRFRAGEPAPAGDELAAAVGATTTVVLPTLHLLVQGAMVLEARARQGDRLVYAPARELQSATLAELSELLRQHGGVEQPLAADAEQGKIDALLARAYDAAAAQLGAVTLHALTERDPIGATSVAGVAGDAAVDASRASTANQGVTGLGAATPLPPG